MNKIFTCLSLLLVAFSATADNFFTIAGDVIAGNLIDHKRTAGDVTITQGTSIEIEASGTVTLQGGFNVEKGATFAVYPSSF